MIYIGFIFFIAQKHSILTGVWRLFIDTVHTPEAKLSSPQLHRSPHLKLNQVMLATSNAISLYSQ